MKFITICHALIFTLALSSGNSISAQQRPPSSQNNSGLGAFNAITGGMNLGPISAPMATYGGSTTFAQGSSSVTQNRLVVAMPLAQSDQDSYSLSLTASSLHFGSAAILSGPATVLPKDFYKIDIGSQFSRRLEDGHSWGARASIGSASNAPFVGLRDMIYSISGNYSFPGTETSHWVLTVFMSNNNAIANSVPIPGFIYLYRTKNFIGMFGVPVASIQWMPYGLWTLSLAIFGPSISTEIIYGSRDEIQFFAGFNWSQQSYLRQNRELDRDRVFLSEMKTVAGLRSPLNSKLSTEFATGYAFNRVVFEGPRLDKRDRGQLELDDAWFAQWNLRYIF